MVLESKLGIKRRHILCCVIPLHISKWEETRAFQRAIAYFIQDKYCVTGWARSVDVTLTFVKAQQKPNVKIKSVLISFLLHMQKPTTQNHWIIEGCRFSHLLHLVQAWTRSSQIHINFHRFFTQTEINQVKLSRFGPGMYKSALIRFSYCYQFKPADWDNLGNIIPPSLFKISG